MLKLDLMVRHCVLVLAAYLVTKILLALRPYIVSSWKLVEPGNLTWHEDDLPPRYWGLWLGNAHILEESAINFRFFIAAMVSRVGLNISVVRSSLILILHNKASLDKVGLEYNQKVLPIAEGTLLLLQGISCQKLLIHGWSFLDLNNLVS